jgi:hypothetical protein
MNPSVDLFETGLILTHYSKSVESEVRGGSFPKTDEEKPMISAFAFDAFSKLRGLCCALFEV